MNGFLINYIKRDKLGMPSEELIREQAKNLKLTYRQARKRIKRYFWKAAK